MTKGNIKLASFEVPKPLLKQFDEAIKDEYGNNRSAALRDLMRRFIQQRETRIK